MVALATLMYEILLTRIFSVTMWYHYAFMAISIAMFGMTVGAMIVYLAPGFFTAGRARYHLALSSLLFAVSIVLSFLAYLSIPFSPHYTIAGLFFLGLTYLVISVPFVLSGICVCLALTKFPQQAGTLYAADLAGAAIGCILLIITLNITDGPTAVIVTAFLASAGSVFFVFDAGSGVLKRMAIISCCLLGFIAVAHTIMVREQHPLLRLTWVKGWREKQPLYEKWNSFSRIKVDGDTSKPEAPFGWGLSATYPSDRKIRQLYLNIDASATTVLTAFDGDLKNLDHLKYDVTNLAHSIRHDARVLVIGTGGGRDVLSALAFGQRSVVGVEINKDIIDAVNLKYGDFTGHLDRISGVTFVNDEARSYVARSRDKFDIIQVSLIDTWAATAAGAFVLTENSLYTVEAWKVFLDHLSPDGVLTFSRWYFRDSPAEMYRLTSLASAALLQAGVKEPRRNIVIARYLRPGAGRDTWNGIGTMLVSRKPFTDEDLRTLNDIAHTMQFDLVLSPRFSLDSTFAAIASGKDLESFTSRFPLNIAAPTDDSPFFFHMLRLRDILGGTIPEQGSQSFNMRAVTILGALLIVVVALTTVCIVVPLLLTTGKVSRKGTLAFSLFFVGIGVGFMQVEISQMQRLIIFLGHPTYGLSVILFALLLASGLGSYSTQRITDNSLVLSATVRLVLLLGALALFGAVTPFAIGLFGASTTPVRILVATAILFPLGIFMGMAFPLGMRVASRKWASMTPWFWGINGAASVCASVIAVAIALSSSISTSFWVGVSSYVVAVVAFVFDSRRSIY